MLGVGQAPHICRPSSSLTASPRPSDRPVVPPAAREAGGSRRAGRGALLGAAPAPTSRQPTGLRARGLSPARAGPLRGERARSLCCSGGSCPAHPPGHVPHVSVRLPPARAPGWGGPRRRTSPRRGHAGPRRAGSALGHRRRAGAAPCGLCPEARSSAAGGSRARLRVSFASSRCAGCGVNSRPPPSRRRSTRLGRVFPGRSKRAAGWL